MDGSNRFRLALCALAAIVFVPAVTGGWIYDDHQLIATNAHVHGAADWTQWFTRDFWNTTEDTGKHVMYWRPAVSASYALDWALGGPRWFHVANLSWQALVGALAFVTLRRWLADGKAAFATALLFALHPSKAEAVAWISGRTDLMCTACVLVAAAGMARRAWWLEALGTIGAYLCKEQAIVLPLIAVIEAWARDRTISLRPAIPQAAIAIAYLIARAIWMPIGVPDQDLALPIATHAGLVLESFGRFAALTVAPHDLSIEHGYASTLTGRAVSVPYALLGAATLVAIAIACWRLRRTRPAISLGLGFFALALVPTANVKLTQLASLISERFLYLPMLGLALVAGSLLTSRRGYLLAGVAAFAYAIASFVHAADFADEDALWERELALHPESNLAREQVVQAMLDRKELRPALALLAAAPDDGERGARLRRALGTAHVAALLAPDREVARLREIDAFLAALIDHRPASLVVDRIQLVLAPTALDAQQLDGALAQRIALASRLGDDELAVTLVHQEVPICATCDHGQAAIAMAAAGRYADADALAPPALALRLAKARELHLQAVGLDPAAIQARGRELAALELWGRAFAAFEPYLDQIKTSPAVAELAFRAGDPVAARRLLPALTDVDGLFAKWREGMGW